MVQTQPDDFTLEGQSQWSGAVQTCPTAGKPVSQLLMVNTERRTNMITDKRSFADVDVDEDDDRLKQSANFPNVLMSKVKSTNV